ncbi:MAG: ABC transporter ATP-binding protein [Trueperaceae bacterium]
MDSPVRESDENRYAESTASTGTFLDLFLNLLSWRFAGLVLLTLLIALASGIALVMLIPMLQVAGLSVPVGAGERVAETVFTGMKTLGVEPNLLSVLALNLLIVAVTASLSRLQAVSSARFNQSVVRSLRLDLYRNLSRSDWLYFAGQRSSRFSHMLLGELERVGGAVSALVSLLVSAGRTLVYTAIAVTLSPILTGLTLALGGGLSLVLLRRTSMARAIGQGVSEAYEALYSTTAEHLAAMKLTKSHALEPRQTLEYAEVSRRVEAAHVDTARNQADVTLWLQVGSIAALSAIVYAALGILALPVTTVLLLLYLFSRLLPLLAGVQRNYQSFISLLPAYGRLRSALEQSERARETVSEQMDPFVLRRGIELEGVTFEYPNGDGAAVLELDLYLPAGQTTAIVGPSGSGKSTVADLVIGLISPGAGVVEIDGEPLTPQRHRAWRSRVGYVSQDHFLFHESIRTNLSIARPEAKEQELWDALESAAADFVGELPDGLDTVVGDRGLRLSGGERQRLVLARALLRDPSLLVLDEATSSLDTENEERIKEAIDRLAGRMTILVIAHRLASIRSAHAIHVLEGGRLIESGTWTTLLEREHSRFRTLAAAQGLELNPISPTAFDRPAESLPR